MLAQLLPQHADFAQRLVPFDDLGEQDLQPLQIDRLRQVVVRALLDSFDRCFDRPLRRQEDRGDVVALLLKPAQQIEAAHLRHHQVGQDDHGPERQRLLQSFFAVRRGLDVESPAADELLQAHTRRPIVLDDEHPDLF